MLLDQKIALETGAIERIRARAVELKMSQKRIGELAFPGSRNSLARVNSILQMDKVNNVTLLRVRLGDFCALCLAVNLNPLVVLEKLLATPE